MYVMEELHDHGPYVGRDLLPPGVGDRQRGAQKWLDNHSMIAGYWATNVRCPPFGSR
jgi:hypothetical protein